MAIEVGSKIPMTAKVGYPSNGTWEVNGETFDKYDIADASVMFENQRVVLFSLPGAFTPVCTTKQFPEFEAKYEELVAAGVDDVYCISVNDPYVMDAWAKISKVENEIIMLADPFGDFANKLGVLVNKDAKGLGMRSSRYTMIIENKVIKYVAVEKETGICELSAADNVLSKL